MSNLETDPRESACGGLADVAAEPVNELLTGRDVVLGGPRAMRVTRTLPNRDVRMVGAWCFVDHYGPERATMHVPPHPHTGLQTVSWLVEGEVLHRDSVGSEQLIRPGQLNLMTAGRAISHAEESPAEAVLHGVQLWVALPSAARGGAPAFEHHPVLPTLTAPSSPSSPSSPGVTVTVIMGELGGVTSPATVHTPLVGAEVTLEAGAGTSVPLRPGFEYAVLALSGTVRVGGTDLSPGPLLYLGSGRSELAVEAEGAGRLLLLGGEPFEERIVMWWNFVGRSHEDIVRFRREWMEGEGFGTVPGAGAAPLPAPELPLTPLKARGRRR
ncbi:pirin family protein [Streptosporangium sp. NBC_01495]|uniref:pirin family protein n=1 Tax=Streptosporangium sp. NBC_01495 TaxID=2903899 RepID=UPI002E358CB6|nr:pirin family protein [Streptosporangium sp. NBC_01495]